MASIVLVILSVPVVTLGENVSALVVITGLAITGLTSGFWASAPSSRAACLLATISPLLEIVAMLES